MGLRRAHVRVWAQGVAMVVLFVAPLQQDRVAQLQSQFQREGDPVRKARVLSRLEPAEMANIRHLAESGSFPEALRLLNTYRDEVLAAQKALDATGTNAENHPAGFKQLQISVRESIRKLGDVLEAVPFAERQPFEDVRQELDRVNKKLIVELFPRQPGRGTKNDKAKP